ncbi:MAG: substrate-binding domain-containing protein [Anaerolineaceae bacterium]
MKMKFLPITVVIILSMIMGACAPAAAPAPEPNVVVETVVVKEIVEVVQTAVPQAEAAPVEPVANPYRPDNLFEIVTKLQEATKGKSAPAGAKYVLLTNAVTPFWTAAQIGLSRASSELNVPMFFNAPSGTDANSAQLSMLDTFINDKYNAITFSAINPKAVNDYVSRGTAEGINFLATDSDASESGRAVYIGMSDYNAGKAAAEAAIKLIGEGKVVGLVGYATATNALERIRGIQDGLKGSKIEYVETLYDDIQLEKALSNAETAIQKYPDLAGFITIYSYNGPLAGQAVKAAGKEGKVKIVAFDAEPETQKLAEEGVVQAMIGQRVYFYGYLSGYVMHAMTVLGKEETMNLLSPYLIGEKNDHLDTGIDIIYADTIQLYKDYLNSIGIASQ